MINLNLNSPEDDSLIAVVLTRLSAKIDWPDYVKLCKHADKGINIKIKTLGNVKSREQENYYRKWCREFGNFCGVYEDEMHDVLLRVAFGTVTESTKIGIVERPRKRSNDVTKDDYSYLIEALIQEAAQLGFVVPPPVRPIEEAANEQVQSSDDSSEEEHQETEGSEQANSV